MIGREERVFYLSFQVREDIHKIMFGFFFQVEREVKQHFIFLSKTEDFYC